eukprot:g955.t1
MLERDLSCAQNLFKNQLLTSDSGVVEKAELAYLLEGDEDVSKWEVLKVTAEKLKEAKKEAAKYEQKVRDMQLYFEKKLELSEIEIERETNKCKALENELEYQVVQTLNYKRDLEKAEQSSVLSNKVIEAMDTSESETSRALEAILRTENEVLRKELDVVKEELDFYRQIDYYIQSFNELEGNELGKEEDSSGEVLNQIFSGQDSLQNGVGNGHVNHSVHVASPPMPVMKPVMTEETNSTDTKHQQLPTLEELDMRLHDFKMKKGEIFKRLEHLQED